MDYEIYLDPYSDLPESADHIRVPINKRGPPYNRKTDRIGYSKGLYDRFLKINFQDHQELECINDK
jgi:hypothetical protein